MTAAPQTVGAAGTVVDGVVLGVPVTVRVPASSANLGPGFDSLGLALDVQDRVSVEALAADGVARSVGVHVVGEGAGDVPIAESELRVGRVR